MTQTTARPAQLAPVRVGKGKAVHLGSLSWVKGPNGEPRYVSYCPAGRGFDKPVTVGEAVAEEITCKSCQRQADAEALQRAADAAQAVRTAAQIEADGANPRSAAQQAQVERWLASHDGAAIPQALAADEVDAYAADGFMTASPPVAIQSIDLTGAICTDTKPHPRHRIIGSFRGGCSGIPAARQALAAPTGIALVTTNDLGVVAVTTGTDDNPRLVCLNHLPDEDTILGEFERNELEPDTKCHECGEILGQPTVDLNDSGAVLSLVMSSLLRADAIEVNLYDDGVKLVGPDDQWLSVIHGTFTPPQIAAHLCIDERDIRDRRDAASD